MTMATMKEMGVQNNDEGPHASYYYCYYNNCGIKKTATQGENDMDAVLKDESMHDSWLVEEVD